MNVAQEIERPAPPVQDFTAQMRDLEVYMTSRFPVYPEIGTTARCPTGDPYVILALGGEVAEGECCMVLTTNVTKAIELFKGEFDKWSAGKDGGIYWRRKPEVSVENSLNEFGGLDQYFRITARLVISDKPRITKEESK